MKTGGENNDNRNKELLETDKQRGERNPRRTTRNKRRPITNLTPNDWDVNITTTE